MRLRRWWIATIVCGSLCALPILGLGCGSFEPLDYFSRNACSVFNCDRFFFIEDLFPLSARPTGALASAAAPAAAEEEAPAHVH